MNSNYLLATDANSIKSAYSFADVSGQNSRKYTHLLNAGAADKEYNGTTLTSITGNLYDVMNEWDVNVSCNGDFTSPNIGTNLDVTTNANLCKLTGLHTGIYSLTLPTGLKATISPAPLTVTATAETITVGETPKLAYAITTGKLSANITKVGSNDILQGTLSASNNYDLTFKSAKLTVKAKTTGLLQTQSMPMIDLGRLQHYDLKGRSQKEL